VQDLPAALAGQGPLHGVRPAGIGAAGDDAEIGARLPEQVLVDVGLGGRRLDVGHQRGAMGQRLLEEALRPLAALANCLCRLRRRLMRRGGEPRAMTTVERLTPAAFATAVSDLSGLALRAARTAVTRRFLPLTAPAAEALARHPRAALSPYPFAGSLAS